MPKQTVDLIFPAQGLDRRGAYQRQPPFTTRAAVNVRWTGALEDRDRGGSRPGLERTFAAKTTTGTVLLDSIIATDGTGLRTIAAIGTNKTLCTDRATPGTLAADGVDFIKTGNNQVFSAPHAGKLYVADPGRSDNVDVIVYDLSDGSNALIMPADTTGTMNGDCNGSTTLVATTAIFATGMEGYTVTFTATGEIYKILSVTNTTTVELTEIIGWTIDYDDIFGAMSGDGNGSSNLQSTSSIFVDNMEGFKVRFLSTEEEYTISSVDNSSEVTLSGNITGEDEDGSFVVLGETVTGGETSGDTLTIESGLPDDCPLICVYRDRLVLAGPDGLWYMSRMGDFTDWNYGAYSSDTQRPVSANNAEAGATSMPITALVPLTSNLLVFGGNDEIWILTGDPAYGGTLCQASKTVGIVSNTAWTITPDQWLVFAGRRGIYMMAPSPCSSAVVLIGEDRLPQELKDINTTANAVCLEWDDEYKGVHVYVTPYSGDTAGSHWWIDWKYKAFWEIALGDNDFQPRVTYNYAPNVTVGNSVVLGCRDGYIRNYDDAVEHDDTETAISNYVEYGPFRLGDATHEGMMTSLVGVLGVGSGAVAWRAYVGATAEAVSDLAVGAHFSSGSFAAGRSNRAGIRMYGGWAKIRLIGSGTAAWAIEGLTVTREAGGEFKL